MDLYSKQLVLTKSHEDEGSSNDNKGLDSICIHQRSQSSYRDIARHLQDILWASTNGRSSNRLFVPKCYLISTLSVQLILF